MRRDFSREVLPVRLIDIAATLFHAPAQGGIHFIVPSSWDFHVVSHTWSLEVRNFSTQIGHHILIDQSPTHVINTSAQPPNLLNIQVSDEIVSENSNLLSLKQDPNVVMSTAQPSNQLAHELIAEHSSVNHPLNPVPNHVISGHKSSNPANQSTAKFHLVNDEIVRDGTTNPELNDVISGKQPANQVADLYNAYFAQADLRGEPAFHGLLEFLGFLAQEGIAFVWFDALCINQTDEQEKAREIANMGAYYSNSIGCYVLVHGIGQGYYFWNADDFVDVLPRWFSRVWTLQELFLPTQVTFVVELPQRVERYIKGLVQEKSSPLIGFCKCCILKDLLQELQDALDPIARVELLNSCGIEVELAKSHEGIEAKETVFPKIPILGNRDHAFCGSGIACPTCGIPSLIRPCKPQDPSTREQRNLFMLERDAYLFLMYLDTFFPLHSYCGNIPRIFSLIQIIQKQEWDPCNVFSDITRRHCTNDEDRVLGVLGLLGVGGDMQVRTGEMAEDQLVNLGRYCISKDQDLLAKLCVVQPIGGPIMGMSWAPSLRYRDLAYEYMGDVCGFSFDFIDDCFGEEVESDSYEYPSSKEGDEIEQVAEYSIEWNEDDARPLNMTVVKASLDQLMSELGRLSNLERKVEFLDCTHHGITMEASVVVGRILPYITLKPRDKKIMRNAFLRSNNCSPSIINPDHIPTHCIYFEKTGIFLPLVVSMFQKTGRVRNELEPVLVMVDAVRPWNMMYFNLPTSTRAKQGVARAEDFLHCVEDDKIRAEIDIQVMLLGVVGAYSVLLMCVGHTLKKLRKLGIRIKKLMELHKVGIFILPISVTQEIFAPPSQGSSLRYLLGGHGDDLSMFVQMRCIKCGRLGRCICRVQPKPHRQSQSSPCSLAKKVLDLNNAKQEHIEMASSSVTDGGISVHVSLYGDKG